MTQAPEQVSDAAKAFRASRRKRRSSLSDPPGSSVFTATSSGGWPSRVMTPL